MRHITIGDIEAPTLREEAILRSLHAEGLSDKDAVKILRKLQWDSHNKGYDAGWLDGAMEFGYEPEDEDDD